MFADRLQSIDGVSRLAIDHHLVKEVHSFLHNLGRKKGQLFPFTPGLQMLDDCRGIRSYCLWVLDYAHRHRRMTKTGQQPFDMAYQLVSSLAKRMPDSMSPRQCCSQRFANPIKSETIELLTPFVEDPKVLG
jgi:hypothetical protein